MMLVVEFGSRRRGDYNVSSDKDLLLLASDWKTLSEPRLRWKKEGFSVSCFTMSRASYLIQTGSLFFKHIIDEGALVSGPSEEYRRVSRQWQQADNYEEEIEDNLDLLEILNFVPQSNGGLAATVDIVIASVRNILIRKLAALGKYVFSWQGVLGSAVRSGLIRHEDVAVFLIARSLKNKYRQGNVPRISPAYVERLMEGGERVFGNPGFRFAGRKRIRELPERCHDGTYKQLRALELLCAEYDFDKSLKAFLDWVREPSYFAAHGPNKPIKPTH